MSPPHRPLIEWDSARGLIRFASDPRCLRDVRRIVEEEARGLGFRDQEIHDLAVAVHEAAMNALVHGNRDVEAGRVEILLERITAYWVIRVRDQGGGLDARQAELAMQGKAPIGRESGRGLRIIGQLVDRVTFADAGREIILWKRLPAG